MDDKKSKTDRESFRLIKIKPVMVFFCLFVLFFGALMAPWPGLKGSYSRFYRGGAQLLFGGFGSNVSIQFRPKDDLHEDVKIIFINKNKELSAGVFVSSEVHLSSRYSGYIYTAFIIALVLASPVPIKRRIWSLWWALILIHVYLALKMALLIVNSFVREPLMLFELGSFGMGLLYIATMFFIFYITPGFTLVVLMWLFITFRRSDGYRLLGLKSPTR